MSKLNLDQADYLFRSEALSGETLAVVRFSGREALSQPFEFRIELVSDNPDIELEAPIGQPACLTLRGRLADGTRYSRFIHGVVESFVQLGAGVRHSRYEAQLVPAVKPLHYTRNSRILQQLSTPDVTRKVLSDGGIPSDGVQSILHESYGPRDYCVQYQESDFAFVQRLWAEEGIFYFFEHKEDRDILVLGDGAYAWGELLHYETVVLRDKPHLYEEGLHELRAGSVLRPGAALLRDFRFKHPGLDMEARAESDKFNNYKMYYFPGDYVDPQLGSRLARVRLEEQQCQKSRYVGSGNVRAMLPGYKFTLTGHRRRDCNQEYLIIAVEHEGSQPGALGEEAAAANKTAYQNRIESIPAGVAYRPARNIPTPSIPGVQTALVVGPSGEEIHCDEHGRVKVQFHWDREGQRDDHSSCWIRVSQPWGGAGQGGMFIPRIGQEVIIQFLEGDPDRPLIVGRVYNGENAVPHGLPAAKNISTIRSSSTPGGGGFNEIKFDDSAGNEEMFIHSQKDRNEIVGNNHSAQVAANQSNSVGANQANSVGANQNESIGGNQSMSVGGSRSASVGGDESIGIGGNQLLQVGANQSISIGGNQDTVIAGNRSSAVGVDDSTQIASNQLLQIGVNQISSIGANQILQVGAMQLGMIGSDQVLIISGNQTTLVTNQATLVSGARSTTVGGADALNCQSYAANVAADMAISVGGSTNLTSGAGITVTGSPIVIEGGSSVSMHGGTLTINGDGVVNINGGTVNIKGGVVKIN